jgi:hypothetical protein
MKLRGQQILQQQAEPVELEQKGSLTAILKWEPEVRHYPWDFQISGSGFQVKGKGAVTSAFVFYKRKL